MKTVFILGAYGEIGGAIVKKFTACNYNVIMPDERELNLESRDCIEAYFQGKSFNVDVIVNSAGINNPKPFLDISYEDIDKTMAINVINFHKVIQYLVPKMIDKRSGYILALSSIYGSFSRRGRLPYVMSKHALNGMVKTLAIELGEFNIKVNALSPGFVDTIMTRKNNDTATIKSFEERIPLGYLASPEDIANIAYFLCSPENNYITGQTLIADGGYTIGGFQK
jgi:3-oxoacyl-[acyl-carrier protein] reductase